MNENCKYCKTAKTCLENADYNSIYCQIHKRIPKIIDKTYDELLEENKQLKEQIEYLRRSIERKESTITELEQEKVPYTNEYVKMLEEKSEKFEKANKDAIELINNINDWGICSKYDCMYKDDVLDILRILDTDKGE